MILIPLFCWCNPYFWWWKKTPFFTMLDASNPYVSWFNHHVSCFSWWFTTNLQDPIAFTFRLAKVRLKSLCFMLISHHFSWFQPPVDAPSPGRRQAFHAPQGGPQRLPLRATGQRLRLQRGRNRKRNGRGRRAAGDFGWKETALPRSVIFWMECRNWTCVLKL